MKTYRGVELKSYVLARLKRAQVEKARSIQYKLSDFLDNKDSKINVCSLYGLRRSGKTVMMYKEIESRGANDCLLINCNKRDSYFDIEREIKSAQEHYIFIDEITKVKDFVLLASSLFDDFYDKRIVIAGTDSASLLFAGETELLDREVRIHTSYISFAEYHYLLGKSLEEYIHYGGLLTNGDTLYNDFLDETIDDYVNSAIVTNILHSVEYADEDTPYRRLRDLYLSGELESAINKTIDRRAREFSLRVMQAPFEKSHYFGSAKDLMKLAKEQYTEAELKVIKDWDNTEIRDYLVSKMKLLAVPDIRESDIVLITNVLKKLDVLQELGDQIIFTQPGIQYALTEELLSGIVKTSDFEKLFPGTQKLMLEKIEQDSIGHIMENVVKNDVIKSPAFEGCEIGQKDNVGNGEFDMYIISPDGERAIVFEIKRRFVQVKVEQTKHLTNKDFCDEFEKQHHCTIVDKVVIYQGETEEVSVNDEIIHYTNATEFLLNLIRVSSILFGGESGQFGLPLEQNDVNKNR